MLFPSLDYSLWKTLLNTSSEERYRLLRAGDGVGEGGRDDDDRVDVSRIDDYQRGVWFVSLTLQVALNAAAKGVTIVKGIVEGQEFRIATLSASVFLFLAVRFRSSECAHRS